MHIKEPTVAEKERMDIAIGAMPANSQEAEQGITLISAERIYEENAKVAGIFWEWRHKIVTHFFAGIAALIAVTGWLYQQASGVRLWLCAPLAFGAAFSIISFVLDKRNAIILRECYRIGAELELNAPNKGSIFKFVNELHPQSGSYTQILQGLYLAFAFLLLGLSILIVVVGW